MNKTHAYNLRPSSGYYFVHRNTKSPMFGDLESLLAFAPAGAPLYYRDINGDVMAF